MRRVPIEKVTYRSENPIVGWAVLIFFLLCVVGWVANIVKLFGVDSLTGETVLRAIGIFVPPLGAILGFL